MKYYSARLLFIILVDDGRPRKRNDYDESVVVFRSRDQNQAFRKALAIGHTMETVYKNKFGQDVRWAFVAIESIRLLVQKVGNGEVSSKLDSRITKNAISFKRRFKPEKSKPEMEE